MLPVDDQDNGGRQAKQGGGACLTGLRRAWHQCHRRRWTEFQRKVKVRKSGAERMSHLRG
jgi:hypothetical protein